MMKKLLLTTLLGLSSAVSFAQKVAGKVVDEKGNALKNVSVQVVGSDSLVSTSDEKGIFVLDCGKNKEEKTTLRITHIGYQPLDIAIDGNEEEMQLGKLTLVKDSYNLQEVTVDAKRQVDRTVHFPSEKMKASANDGFELVNKMMLPGVVVNLGEKSLSMLNKESILLYINDKPASKAEMMGLRPVDVIKVEFIDAPGAEYGFDTNVGGVIKFFCEAS